MRYAIRATMSETDDGEPVRRWMVGTGGGYSPGSFRTWHEAWAWVASDCAYRLGGWRPGYPLPGRPGTPEPARPAQPPTVAYVAIRDDVEAPSTVLGITGSPETAQRIAQAHWQRENDADSQRAPGPVPLLGWFDDSEGRPVPTWAAEAGRYASYSIEQREVMP